MRDTAVAVREGIGLLTGSRVLRALVHRAAGVAHESLLHRPVAGPHRATVLSLASMAMQPAGSLGSVVLGVLATGVSTALAIAVGGVVLALAAPLFLVRGR
ncbi:hypothetical protein BH708_04995 [Brachybacterium sp. P6-10-X1]|uniref:hypothetical protein n=1 Tax=Brachybacterium sp. P6-10-X1 TaxID=1903186 RepID=UPI000971A0DB|nr:hypothetical protein [Brachybacterium sp. P6-10-X1]APX32188.1 hypothetical protein BH708_04995 [Brachybacterium sp. P6-10-X1]